MNPKRIVIVAAALVVALALDAAPTRKMVVLYPGHQVTYSTDYTLLTVEPPESLKASTNAAVQYGFEQYGQTVVLKGRKSGYGKLLLEKADSNIGGVLHVVVTDKTTYQAYQRILTELTGVDGISADTILVTDGRVLIGGAVYSKADLDRCVGFEKAFRKPKVTCAARLSSAVNVVFPAEQYDVRASVETKETADPIAGGEDRGLEGESLWTVTVRLGDVPVLGMESRQLSSFVPRIASFCDELDTVIQQWTADTAKKKVPYPATFSAVRTSSGYELRGQWRFTQGSRGSLLAKVTADDVVSFGVPGRAVNWWAAILQDTFHLYFLAERPARTLSATSPMPLVDLYDNAVRIEPTFSKENARSALSRSYFSILSSTGTDPFDQLLVQVPTDFKESSD